MGINKQLEIELAFFLEDDLLCRGKVCCADEDETLQLNGSHGYRFTVSAQYEEPACPVEIICHLEGEYQYKSALRVGVHTSDDWESINLGNIHTLGFRCTEVEVNDPHH